MPEITLKYIFLVGVVTFIGYCLPAIPQLCGKAWQAGLLDIVSPNSAFAQSASNNLVLSWSTNTYVPPTYFGKPLPTYGSLIVAAVDATSKAAGDPKNLNYDWFLDNEKQLYASGAGRTQFLFRASKNAGGFHFVAAQVKDANNNIVAELKTTIPIVAPEVLIYPAESQSAPPSVIAINAASASGEKELNFIALSYFFDIPQPNNLQYLWLFEGQEVIKIEKSNKFSLKIHPIGIESPMTKELEVSIANPKNIFQIASNKIQIIISPAQ